MTLINNFYFRADNYNIRIFCLFMIYEFIIDYFGFILLIIKFNFNQMFSYTKFYLKFQSVSYIIPFPKGNMKRANHYKKFM